jgi:hypothetical protein
MSRARCRCVAQGIGWALNEEYIYNKQGKVDNPGFLDYRMPVCSDLPMLDTIMVEVPNPKHPQGVKGVGEVPLVPVMAAVANAVHNALGKRFYSLPMSPPKVLEVLDAPEPEGDSSAPKMRVAWFCPPAGVDRFEIFFVPDGGKKAFSLSGDQLYIDAHILKWKPLANILGLHTSYELDRVAGRYAILNEETTKVHTVYSLSKDRSVDLFDLRRRFAILNPLLDAEYGSATFINSNSAEEFRVMVSTTGLLIRKTEKITGQ